jgi:hypothetical protein
MGKSIQVFEKVNVKKYRTPRYGKADPALDEVSAGVGGCQ